MDKSNDQSLGKMDRRISFNKDKRLVSFFTSSNQQRANSNLNETKALLSQVSLYSSDLHGDSSKKPTVLNGECSYQGKVVNALGVNREGHVSQDFPMMG